MTMNEYMRQPNLRTVDVSLRHQAVETGRTCLLEPGGFRGGDWTEPAPSHLHLEITGHYGSPSSPHYPFLQIILAVCNLRSIHFEAVYTSTAVFIFSFNADCAEFWRRVSCPHPDHLQWHPALIPQSRMLTCQTPIMMSLDLTLSGIM